MTESTLELPAKSELCACSHPKAQHDAVATRFCGATVSGALHRPCVCPTPQDTPARSYDRR